MEQLKKDAKAVVVVAVIGCVLAYAGGMVVNLRAAYFDTEAENRRLRAIVTKQGVTCKELLNDPVAAPIINSQWKAKHEM